MRIKVKLRDELEIYNFRIGSEFKLEGSEFIYTVHDIILYKDLEDKYKIPKNETYSELWDRWVLVTKMEGYHGFVFASNEIKKV